MTFPLYVQRAFNAHKNIGNTICFVGTDLVYYGPRPKDPIIVLSVLNTASQEHQYMSSTPSTILLLDIQDLCVYSIY